MSMLRLHQFCSTKRSVVIDVYTFLTYQFGSLFSMHAACRKQRKMRKTHQPVTITFLIEIAKSILKVKTNIFDVSRNSTIKRFSSVVI